MSVSQNEVRSYLENMPVTRVSEPAMQTAIRMADHIIDYYKSETATKKLIKDAVLAYAGYLGYLAYATEYERTAGKLPGAILIHLDRYKELADMFLLFVISGSVGTINGGQAHAVAHIKTFWQEYNTDQAYR